MSAILMRRYQPIAFDAAELYGKIYADHEIPKETVTA